MAYTTKVSVKRRLGLALSETQYDSEIDEAIAWADGFIDAEFTHAGAAVPATIPNLIKSASADLAAYHFLRSREPDKATRFYEDGLIWLDKYIQATYGKSVVIRTGICE